MGFMKSGKAISKVLGEMGIERSSEQGMFMAKQMIGEMNGGRPIKEVRELGQKALQTYKDAETAFYSNAEGVSRYGTFDNSLRGKREATVQRTLDAHRTKLAEDKARYQELVDQRAGIFGQENLEAFKVQYGDELTRLQGDIRNNPLTRANTIKRAEEQRIVAEKQRFESTFGMTADEYEKARNAARAEREANQVKVERDARLEREGKASTSEPSTKVPSKASSAQQGAEAAAEQSKEVQLSYNNYTSDLNRAKLAAGKDFMGRESRNEYFVERMNKRKAEIDAMKTGDERTAAIENFNQDLQSGPGINDYLMGNKIPHKAAGFGIAAVAADVAMGDGRRSNAQLYSSPF